MLEVRYKRGTCISLKIQNEQEIIFQFASLQNNSASSAINAALNKI